MKPLGHEVKRSVDIRVTLRPGEHEDLRTIAAGWGVPVSTALWAILHERLSEFRRMESKLGKDGLAIAAGLRVLRAGRREVTAERASHGAGG